MVDKINRPGRRTMLLSCGAIALAGIGFATEKLLKKVRMKNIEEMTDEFQMLKNIKLRNAKLGTSTLEIKNASFGENFTDYIICENTVFSDCEFEPGSGIRIKALSNVKFERCHLNDTNMSGGIWTDVTFTDCVADGQFLILADEGSKNLVFNNCNFSGPGAVVGSVHSNHFGAVGSYGNASFNKCTIKYSRIIGDISLTVKNSQLRKISASSSRKYSVITFENVNIQEYITFEEGVFSDFVMKECNFEFMNMDDVKSKRVALEDCVGHFVGKFMNLEEMTAKNCTFESTGEKRAPFGNLTAALSIVGSKINSITFDSLKFNGTNGTMYLGGSENPFYDSEDAASKKLETSDFRNLIISNTPLINAFLGYIKASQLILNNSDVENSNFSKSDFGKIAFSNIRIGGKIDFGASRVVEFTKKEITAKPSLDLVSDVTRVITL